MKIADSGYSGTPMVYGLMKGPRAHFLRGIKEEGGGEAGGGPPLELVERS